MTHKQIDQLREVRLWVSQVIIPAGIIGGIVLGDENRRNAIKTKVNCAKEKLIEKKKKLFR